MTTPSTGAMRAANYLESIGLTTAGVKLLVIAAFIDRETGLSELVEAAKAVLEMPSACCTDGDIIENNTRRQRLRNTLAKVNTG